MLTPRGSTAGAKLIARGLDAPATAADFAELRGRLASLETLPFDGMVVDLGRTDRRVFTSTPLSRASLQTAVDAWKTIPFRRFTDNFQELALGQPSADFDWWNDAYFSQVTANMELAATLVREAGLRGFAVDNQVYRGQQWSHAAQPGMRTFAENFAKVAARGEAVMAAALRGHPDVTFLLSWGYSELFRQVCVDGVPLETHLYGLYPAFLDGMGRALATARGTIVDAYLPAYPTKNPDDFAVYYNLIRFRWDRLLELWRPGIATHWDAAPPGMKYQPWRATPRLVCDSTLVARLGRDLPAGFGLMLDYDAGTGFTPDPAGLASNHFSPEAFEAALVGALRATDRYVWIWQESMSWFGLSRVAKPSLPATYLNAIANARQKAGRSNGR